MFQNQDEFDEENSFEPMTRTASPVNLRSYLEDLYKKKNLGDDERAKLETSVADSKPGAGLTFLASLGAGIAGNDQIKAVDSLHQGSRDAQKNLDAFDAKRKGAFDELKQDREIGKFEREQKDDMEAGDPESEKSRLMQSVAARMFPGRDFSKTSAKDLGTVLPQLKSIMDQELNAQIRKDDRDYKREELGIRRQDNQIKREEKATAEQMKREEKVAATEEKKKAALAEVEDRRRNIEDNVTILENMIKEKGTYEAFGSHNQDMDRLAEAIATDMAKLSDPSSVARPSEVEAVKKNLVRPGMGQRNSTALDILKNFRGEINRRADNAYKVRGVDIPAKEASALAAPSKPKTVVQNGVTYTLNEKTGEYE